LFPKLRELAVALRHGKLEDAAQRPNVQITQARDDVRNALRIAPASYDAMSWIYGPKALGLRFAPWISRRADRRMKAGMVLGFITLRDAGADLLPSEKIAQLGENAERLCNLSQQLRALRNDPRFADIITGKRLRRAFKGKISMGQFLAEGQRARMVR
jgi:hypothetical protein